MDGFDSSNDLLISFFVFWGTIPSTPKTIDTTFYFHVPQRLLSLCKIQLFIQLFAFFYFRSMVRWNGNISFLRVNQNWVGSFGPDWVNFKVPENLMYFFSLDRFLLEYSKFSHLHNFQWITLRTQLCLLLYSSKCSCFNLICGEKN